LFLHKTFKALNGLLCADVPLRNYSLTYGCSVDYLSLAFLLFFGVFIEPVTRSWSTDEDPLQCQRHLLNWVQQLWTGP